MKQVIHTKVLGFVALSLTGIMLTSGAILSNITVDKASAAASTTERVAITVSSSCSLSATINTEHSANLINGIYSGTSGYYPDGIGKSTITAICNNPSGFAIYAVGYSGTPETYGNTSLIGADTGIIIPTGTATSGDRSEWAMKIGKVTDSSAYQPENLTIENGFDNYHAVPNDYTKVASFSSTTDATIGSKITTTYAAYISVAQAADTYIGEVKYTLVHPHSASSPSVLNEYNISYLQDFSRLSQTELEELKSKMLIDRVITLTDSRDGKAYNIAKLGDDNIWLLDNLALDLTDRSIASKLSSANTNASETSLNYLRNGGGTSSDLYAKAGLSYSNWTEDDSNTIPLLHTSMMNATNQNDNLSDEAKTWKYGIYYNFCATSAGSWCRENITSGNPSEDICPKGWRIPTGGNSQSEYEVLRTGGYGYSSGSAYRLALHLPLSGHSNNGSYNQTNEGLWWSSTRSGNNIYYLSASTGGASSGLQGSRTSGHSVRCILDISHTQTISSAYYMQDVTSEIVNNTEIGTTATLKDNRDNANYAVIKLADGNLWMLDNLALDLTSSTVVNKLSSTNTNASDTSLNYLRNGGGTSSDKYAINGLNYSNWNGNYTTYSAPLVNTSYKNSTYSEDTLDGATAWKYGVYYNYCAASAGSYCYGNGTNSGPATGDATEDICPKGWRLPTASYNGEYRNLYTNTYGYNTISTYRTALHLPFSGLINSGQLNESGITGRWWGSTIYSSMDMNDLFISASEVNANLSNHRDIGASIRCIFNLHP